VAGSYFVAYDRDKQQFDTIDADDPANDAYSTDGCRDLGYASSVTCRKVGER
jgi:hypothetical protein